jgi:hypothetical protein
MRIRRLALIPLLYVVVFVVIVLWLGGGDALPRFLIGQRLLLRLLAISGCLAAVSAFDRGDHLRRAWILLGTSTTLVLARDLLHLAPFAPPPGSLVPSVLLVLGNLAGLTGIWILARSWRVASISLPGGRAGAVAVTLAAAALALLVAGPEVLREARAVGAGDLTALSLLFAAVVDVLTLILLAPLLLTTLALRGGLFAWPWGLLTANAVAWLLYDGAAALAPILTPHGFPLTELFRGVAETSLFVAGLAQKRAIDLVRRAT